MLAGMKGHSDMCKLLINSGCNYRKMDFDGKIVLEKVRDPGMVLLIKNAASEYEVLSRSVKLLCMVKVFNFLRFRPIVVKWPKRKQHPGMTTNL
jgi:hypothetical protein